MSKESKEKPEIKVTDRRIFTADGEIREEYRSEIQPTDAQPVKPPEPATAPPPPPQQQSTPKPVTERRTQSAGAPPQGERRHTIAEKGESPETPFSNFIQSLVMQAYMMLGMLRNPYQPQTKPDPAAARELIDILGMLQQKTAGNLTPEEDDFLATHLAQLKLAYVQVTKNLS